MCRGLLQMVLLLPSALPYSHIDTPFYKVFLESNKQTNSMIPCMTPPPTQVVLSSSYEDHLVGVHLANKEEQDAAMQVSASIEEGARSFWQILIHLTLTMEFRSLWLVGWLPARWEMVSSWKR